MDIFYPTSSTSYKKSIKLHILFGMYVCMYVYLKTLNRKVAALIFLKFRQVDSYLS